MSFLDEKLAQCMQEVHGEKGKLWIKEFPQLIESCEKRWKLQIQEPFTSLTYNFVAPAIREDGTKVVLKLGVPNKELTSEFQALQIYAGRGIAHLYEADANLGAMVLERLKPGSTLSTLTDVQHATSIATDIMQQLFRPVPEEHEFPLIADLAKGLKKLRTRFDGKTGPLPAFMVEKAETLFEELTGSITQPVLLHGDLHHDNILAAERQPWLAIDPKGVIGEREYEPIQYLLNYLFDKPNPFQTLERRIDIFVEQAGFDRERLISWGYAKCVLSAWWSLDDHGHGWEKAIQCAELFDQLL